MLVTGRRQRLNHLLRLVMLLLVLFVDPRNVQGTLGAHNDIKAVSPSQGVQLLRPDDHHVVMDNGIISVTLTVPQGAVAQVTYKGSDNLLATKYREDERGHWDVVWNRQPNGDDDMIDNLEGTSYKVLEQNENQVEISFTTSWTIGSSNVPLNIDKRFVMLRDSPGFYTYAVFERLEGWPSYSIQEGRLVFKLQDSKFHYMAVSDVRQRFMPTCEDRTRGQILDFKEAVLLTNCTNPEFNREVDDKYFYSSDNKDSLVHGWVSNDNTPVGFWMITPSNEFRTGGPLKQDLTSHVGPTVLSMFISRHYAGEDIDLKFGTEEHWKKVIGPVFVYLNSDGSASRNPSVLWNDAKQRMEKEVASWPYNFPLSDDYLKSNQRGGVSGQLLVHDRFINDKAVPAASAFVGLAPPGAAGSWQLESKGYQFWTQTDESGNFLIKNAIPGTYSLFAWVPGTLGDYKHASDIIITPGSIVKVDNVVFEPPRNGPTFWEIGIPDRTAAEFFVPCPSHKFKIHEYGVTFCKFKQYGLWKGYENIYPNSDLVFTIGKSDYRGDWFFTHMAREIQEQKRVATTWQIQFYLQKVDRGAEYTLQLALASASEATLQVRFNDPNSVPHFTTGRIGKDNAVPRYGNHGIYHFYSIRVEGSWLVVGWNTIFLTQAKEAAFSEVMYDYIRLEGSP